METTGGAFGAATGRLAGAFFLATLAVTGFSAFFAGAACLTDFLTGLTFLR